MILLLLKKFLESSLYVWNFSLMSVGDDISVMKKKTKGICKKIIQTDLVVI